MHKCPLQVMELLLAGISSGALPQGPKVSKCRLPNGDPTTRLSNKATGLTALRRVPRAATPTTGTGTCLRGQEEPRKAALGLTKLAPKETFTLAQHPPGPRAVPELSHLAPAPTPRLPSIAMAATGATPRYVHTSKSMAFRNRQ